MLCQIVIRQLSESHDTFTNYDWLINAKRIPACAPFLKDVDRGCSMLTITDKVCYFLHGYKLWPIFL